MQNKAANAKIVNNLRSWMIRLLFVDTYTYIFMCH